MRWRHVTPPRRWQCADHFTESGRERRQRYGEASNIRKIVGADGAEKVQIRVMLGGFHGILQFNCDGRPDGKRPHGRAFAVDYYEELMCAPAAGEEIPVKPTLTHEQAEELFEESFLMYHRYVVLLQVGDYARVICDTGRNMKLFRLVHTYAEASDDRDRLEKWWPYIIRIHHTARIMLELKDENYDQAKTVIHEARGELDRLAAQEEETFRMEMQRSKESLDELEKAVDERRPLSQVEVLEREQQKAIRHEDYERAAQLRDLIDELRDRDRQQ